MVVVVLVVRVGIMVVKVLCDCLEVYAGITARVGVRIKVYTRGSTDVGFALDTGNIKHRSLILLPARRRSSSRALRVERLCLFR